MNESMRAGFRKGVSLLCVGLLLQGAVPLPRAAAQDRSTAQQPNYIYAITSSPANLASNRLCPAEDQPAATEAALADLAKIRKGSSLPDSIYCLNRKKLELQSLGQSPLSDPSQYISKYGLMYGRKSGALHAVRNYPSKKGNQKTAFRVIVEKIGRKSPDNQAVRYLILVINGNQLALQATPPATHTVAGPQPRQELPAETKRDLETVLALLFQNPAERAVIAYILKDQKLEAGFLAQVERTSKGKDATLLSAPLVYEWRRQAAEAIAALYDADPAKQAAAKKMAGSLGAIKEPDLVKLLCQEMPAEFGQLPPTASAPAQGGSDPLSKVEAALANARAALQSPSPAGTKALADLAYVPGAVAPGSSARRPIMDHCPGRAAAHPDVAGGTGSLNHDDAIAKIDSFAGKPAPASKKEGWQIDKQQLALDATGLVGGGALGLPLWFIFGPAVGVAAVLIGGLLGAYSVHRSFHQLA